MTGLLSFFPNMWGIIIFTAILFVGFLIVKELLGKIKLPSLPKLNSPKVEENTMVDSLLKNQLELNKIAFDFGDPEMVDLQAAFLKKVIKNKVKT